MADEATVFIVDDDVAIRDSMTRLIESVGLQSRACPSADEFLRVFDGATAGCVVLDVRMPGMSGLELQDRLAEMGHPIPVIFVTGHADVPMAVRSMKAGATDFIEKPFRPQVLLDAIQRAIARDKERRRRLDELQEIQQRIESLTAREHEVLEMVVSGSTSRQIAANLGLSPKTVHVHRAEIMAKMCAGSVADLTRMVVTAQHLSGSRRR